MVINALEDLLVDGVCQIYVATQEPILEKFMYARFYEFLNENKSFYDVQFGFRAKHSVNHALIDITESVRIAVDDGKIACGVFLDLQKAFDAVDHKILIDKLKYYGIRGTANNWLASYLSNRRQFVSILGFESDTKTLRHGSAARLRSQPSTFSYFHQ